MTLVSLMLATCAIIGRSSSEVRFICPRPQTPDSSITQGPCGPGGLSGQTGYITDVSPGPLTVRWEETVFRRGAPSRIALKSRSQNTTCVLLDQIPHNSNQFLNKGTDCNVTSYPIGNCRRSTTIITVLIPDIQCDDCYLQLMSIDTSSLRPEASPCSLNDENSACPVYYSCANIKIWPTQTGEGRSLSSCLAYPDNLDGHWPFSPITTFSVDPGVFSIFFDSIAISLQGNFLVYDVQARGLDARNIVPNTAGLYDTNLGLLAKVFTRTSRNETSFQGFSELTEPSLKQRLLNNQLSIGLRNLISGLILIPLEVNSTLFPRDTYFPFSMDFSSRGNLRVVHPAFTNQSLPLSTTPFEHSGQCALASRQMNVALTEAGGDDRVKALLRFSVVEYTAYVTAVIPQTDDLPGNSSLSLSLTRSVTSRFPITNRVSIPSRYHRETPVRFVVEGIGSLEAFLSASLGATPDAAEALLRSGSVVRNLNGGAEPGFSTAIRDEMGDIIGLATINFMTGVRLDSKLLLANFTFPPQLGGLFGPALPGREGPRLFVPTSNVTLEQVASGSWLVGAVLEVNSARAIRHLWSGLYYISVSRDSSTPHRSISGQLSKVDRGMCTSITNVACLVSDLTVPNFSRGLETVPTSAFVTYFPLDRERVQFSVIVRDLSTDERVSRIELRNDRLGTTVDITPEFFLDPFESNALEGEGVFNMSGGVESFLTGSDMRMIVFTSRYPNGQISGVLPTADPGLFADVQVNGTVQSLPPTVTAEQFSLQCGSEATGPMRIELRTTAPVAAVYAEHLQDTCSFRNDGTSWILENARAQTATSSACGIQILSNESWVSYELIVIVQAEPQIQTGDDGRFSLSCNFTADGTQVIVVSNTLNVTSKPLERKQEVIRGRVDQLYTMAILNSNRDAVITSAVIGDPIVLVVSMAGTDEDEQSLRIVRCTVSDSSRRELTLIENYCPVERRVLSGDTGFFTTGQRAELSGLEAFRLQNSPDDFVVFSCVVEPCASGENCEGSNCRPATARRKRESNSETLLRVDVEFRVKSDVYDKKFEPGSLSDQQTSEESSEVILLTVISVLSLLLLVSVLVTVIILCRRYKQKQ